MESTDTNEQPTDTETAHIREQARLLKEELIARGREIFGASYDSILALSRMLDPLDENDG